MREFEQGKTADEDTSIFGEVSMPPRQAKHGSIAPVADGSFQSPTVDRDSHRQNNLQEQ